MATARSTVQRDFIGGLLGLAVGKAIISIIDFRG
jgi:hypothetical protein